MVDINVQDLKKKIDAKEDFFFLDVREPHEYDEYNMKAVNIPLGVLPVRLHELEEYKDMEIIVHCRSGARSAAAKHIMIEKGFKNVRNLLGGAMEFQKNYG